MAITPRKTTCSRYVVRDQWMTLRADRCETAIGVVLDPYYVQELEDWVQVVAFDHQDRILLTRHYRHGAGRVCMELPCGVVERGETPAQAASRELLEETGCTSEMLLPLPVPSPNPARYSNRIHAFIATGTQRVQEQFLDETEQIEYEFLTLRSGWLDHGPNQAALDAKTSGYGLTSKRAAPTSGKTRARKSEAYLRKELFQRSMSAATSGGVADQDKMRIEHSEASRGNTSQLPSWLESRNRSNKCAEVPSEPRRDRRAAMSIRN